jgi:hypothetical protein
MPYHYTLIEKQYGLKRLIANRGNIPLTAKELGITTTSLYRWREWAESGKIPGFSPSMFSTISTQPASIINDSNNIIQHSGELPADDLQALRDLKAKMLELVAYIVAADKIKTAIDSAPLNQRIGALVQLTDRIIKLAAELPADEDDEMELSDDVEEVDDEEDA